MWFYCKISLLDDIDKIRLYVSGMFADFTFRLDYGGGRKVHKFALSAHSEKLEEFFKQHKDVRKLRQHNSHLNSKFDLSQKTNVFNLVPKRMTDTYLQSFSTYSLQFAFLDVIYYCYIEGSLDFKRDKATSFAIAVTSLLLTLSIADHLGIPGLVTFIKAHFKTAFSTYVKKSSPAATKKVLKKCLSDDYLVASDLCEEAVPLLRNTAFDIFAEQVEQLKQDGNFESALELVEAIPLSKQFEALKQSGDFKKALELVEAIPLAKAAALKKGVKRKREEGMGADV